MEIEIQSTTIGIQLVYCEKDWEHYDIYSKNTILVVPHSWLSWFTTSIARFMIDRQIELVNGGCKLCCCPGLNHPKSLSIELL